MARQSKESKKRKSLYDMDYKKKSYRRYRLDVRYDDTEVIDFLESLENKNKYLLDLIKQDIKTRQ